jgi:hypothetical protein
MYQEQKITQNMMEFQPSQKQTQFATYNSIFTPNKCKETGKEAPTIQEGTYQTHR